MAIPTAAEEAAQETAEKVMKGVAYVGVTVSDIEASAEFYSESADLKEVAQGRLEKSVVLDAVAGRKDVAAESRLLESSNAQVRLMQFDSGLATETGAVSVNGPGFAHVCYRSDQTLETYQKFLARGAKPLGNPEMVTLSSRFPVVYAYSLDHDGIMFEVEHVNLEGVEGGESRAGFKNIRHISLASPDMKRAVAFYSVLLATPNPRVVGGEEGLSGEPFDQVSGLPGTRMLMAWFQVGNLEVEVVQYLSHPTEAPNKPRPLTAPGYNMVVFDVTSLAAARELLLEAGGTVVTEPMKMDGGEIFFGRDPDLNLLGFQVVGDDSIVSSKRFQK